MAHNVWKEAMEKPCPRCGADEATFAMYHFGATVTAECVHCAFGHVSGDNAAMARARLLGKYYEGAK